MAGKPGKSGPKPGNKNALRHGARIDVRRLVVGELPRPMVACKREARGYRRELEGEVLLAQGLATVEELLAAGRSTKAWELITGRINSDGHHTINAAVQQTIAIAINRWLLRNRFEKMTVADIRACNKEMREAAKDRARIVRTLELNIPPEQIKLETYIIEAENNNEHHPSH